MSSGRGPRWQRTARPRSRGAQVRRAWTPRASLRKQPFLPGSRATWHLGDVRSVWAAISGAAQTLLRSSCRATISPASIGLLVFAQAADMKGASLRRCRP